MRGIVDQPAIQHRCHFVNAVGKQEAAIKDRDLGVSKRHERAVDVSDLFQVRSPVSDASDNHIRKLLVPITPPLVIPGRREAARPESITTIVSMDSGPAPKWA